MIKFIAILSLLTVAVMADDAQDGSGLASGADAEAKLVMAVGGKSAKTDSASILASDSAAVSATASSKSAKVVSASILASDSAASGKAGKSAPPAAPPMFAGAQSRPTNAISATNGHVQLALASAAIFAVGLVGAMIYRRRSIVDSFSETSPLLRQQSQKEFYVPGNSPMRFRNPPPNQNMPGVLGSHEAV
jgi:hypothetical protein